ARMGAAGAAASEKLLAMGQQVPEGIQRITNASKEAAEKLTAMGQDFGIQKVATEFKALGDHTATATTSFGSLVASFVTAEAITAGVKMAFRAVVDLAKEMGQIALQGAAVADVEENFRHLTEQAGLLGDTLLGTLRA